MLFFCGDGYEFLAILYIWTSEIVPVNIVQVLLHKLMYDGTRKNILGLPPEQRPLWSMSGQMHWYLSPVSIRWHVAPSWQGLRTHGSSE